MILSYQSIVDLCTPGRPGGPLIEDFDEERCKSAGYDLRIGSSYYVGHERRENGVVEIRTLSNASPTFELVPNQIALIEVHERLRLPVNVVGHISLKMDLLLQGIVMASQSQIDAGYEGNLTILIYNLSDSSVTLKLFDELVRVEFAHIDADTKKPYEGNLQGKGLVVDKRIESSLSGMSKQVQNVKIEAHATVSDAVAGMNRSVSDAVHKLESGLNDLESGLDDVESRRSKDVVGAALIALTLLLVIAGLFGVLFAQQGSIQHEASDAQSAANAVPTSLGLKQQIADAKKEQAALAVELRHAQAVSKQEAATIRSLEHWNATTVLPDLDFPSLNHVGQKIPPPK